MAAKVNGHQSVIGQRGGNLIEKRILEMGWLWHPTGVFDAGIDGFIELRDPATGEALNSIIQVQSRAANGRFTGETDRQFEYLCTERDLAYWLAGNAPVILVCSRPDTEEAYWVSLKDYFRDPERRRSRRIVFDKQRDRLTGDAREPLQRLAIPKDAGIYFSSLPVS